MKTLDLSRYDAGRDYSVWPIDFAFSASFEVPLRAVQDAVPAGVHPLEPRPGLALLNFAVFRFPAGTHGLAEPCCELVMSAHVLPDLALAPALPRMAMFTFRIGATAPAFIGSAFATDHYPVHPEPLDIRIDPSHPAVTVADASGAPILGLRAADGVTPPYDTDRFYVQSLTASDGRLYCGGNLFEFRRAENQRHLKSGGGPSPHAFYGAVDVTSITPAQGYVQMWSEPGTVGCENHFFLQPVTRREHARP